MESSSSSVPGLAPANSVAERTQKLLKEMETRYKDTGSRANVVIILGRSGSGKSSASEDLSGSDGHSQQSIDSITQRVQIVKAVIDKKDFFVMDTPGFDPGSEQKVFLEIVRGIRTIGPFAQIIGLLYLTCINQPRFDQFDRKLVRFIRAFCGDEYLPRITFVTTFWTAAGPRQQTTFNQQLEFLRRNWQKAFDGQEPILYQHGREYNLDGQDTGRFVDWFENRVQIAQYGKEMIVRRYGERGTPETCTASPRIVHELNANTPIHDTQAGRLLGMPSASASSSVPSPGSEEESTRRTSSASHSSDRPSTDEGRRPSGPQLSTGSDPRTESQQHQGSSVDWSQVAADVIGWISRNVEFNVHSGGGRRHEHPLNGATAYNGPLDMNSPVDFLKMMGEDSSWEARWDYGVKHGIKGVPGSLEWGEAMLEHLRRNYG
ncbi:uncharacterized protein A1O5_07121 [Cladophialophora psammophila CBS 110553]|uniref:AIG1-type G domain-containing protein n=1 Tax=Cladophialophora psammophila CBS 110553 TaxID=1182543 RepID=W9WQ60_9EURO|nr:uncharacterized protein A1O5_07121 [Cladophialophora psammophila CBS 110553]EXJ70048.1 hypothetical protein A1O5_07121 [Cladophialophora psammophila CBS 110553]